jgi:hypothetical protein
MDTTKARLGTIQPGLQPGLQPWRAKFHDHQATKHGCMQEGSNKEQSTVSEVLEVSS